MKLSELIHRERIVLPLDGGALPAAAGVLVERLVAAGVVDDPDKLRNRVAEERGEDIVALGDRAFITHYRTDAVHDLVLALGVSPTPIPRDLRDSEAQHARIVVLILAPPRMAARYLQVLGAFVRLLADQAVVAEIQGAPDAAALAALPLLRRVELPEQIAVGDMMSERPRTTSADSPLRDAALVMVRSGIGALPVLDSEGLLVGMLSDRELMRDLVSNYLQGNPGHHPNPGRSAAQRTVRDVMTRQVLCVSPEQPLAEVASLMINKDVDRVPVVREGRLVGFLTRSDIVRKLIGS